MFKDPFFKYNFDHFYLVLENVQLENSLSLNVMFG